MPMASSSANNQSQNEQDDSSSYALQLAFSSALPMTLHAAIQLGIFDVIEDGVQISPQEIAQSLGILNPDAPMMLDRILRLLASHSVVTCSVSVDDDDDDNNGDTPQRLYGLAPVCKYFAKDKDGVSLGPFMNLVQDHVFLDSWSQLKNAVVEGGIPFNKVHGTHAFEYAAKDSRFNEVFNKAMLSFTGIVMNKILESYNGFEHLKQLVDVGGGLGVMLNLITSKYTSIKGINYDLPHVIQHAPSYPRVEHVGGDMFQKVPNGDAIFMKWILHDWSDDNCLKLLKNCYNAIPRDGKLIVVDAIAPLQPGKDATSKFISQMDMTMMTQNPGGKERTKQEFMILATKAGFSGIKFQCFVFDFCVMEFFK